MAKLGNFLNVTAIRGSVGGDVYTRGRSGPTMRARVKGRNPRSSRQSVARANMAEGARAAKSLSLSNKALWVTYAASITKHNSVSGAAYHPSWITAFNEVALPFYAMTPGGTAPVTPPTSPFVGDVITLTAAGASGKITFTGSAQQTSGMKTALLVQLLASPNRTPNPNGYTLNLWGEVPATPFHLDTGPLPAGTYAVGYKFGLIATGQETLPVFLANVIVT